MYHFFIKPEQAAAHEVAIIGSDVNHIKNVLRMKVGEQIVLTMAVMNIFAALHSLMQKK